MINKKIIIAAIAGLVVGLAVGTGAMIPAVQHQKNKKTEALFLLETLLMFIDKSPECLEALERL